MRIAILLSLPSLTLLAACIPALPPRQPVPQDPFAGLFDSAPPAYPNLTVAVFMSENSKNSARYGLESAQMMPGAEEAMRGMLDQDVDRLKKNFKAAVRIESLADAPKSGADLVMVIDMQVQTGRSFRKTDTLTFMTLEGRTLDTISSEANESFGMLDPMGAVTRADKEAEEKLMRALRNSAPLAELAKSKGGAPVVAEAPAKIYHSDVDKPIYAADPRPDDFALIIGVEKYQSLPPAEFAERDAASVRSHLLALGYPAGNIIYLTGSKASRTGIEKYVDTWLPLNIKEDSRLFVYFSGHGAPDPATSQAYLVPWDGDPKFLKDSGYSIKHLYESLNALKAKQIVLAMDACFSGQGGRSVLAKGARPLVTKVDTGLSGPGKLVVFSASAADEITGSEDSQGHGLFTYYFLKGLNEKAGKTTLKGLYDFLLPNVKDGAHRDGREQTPQLMAADTDSPASTSF